MFETILVFMNKCVRYISLGMIFLLVINYFINPKVLPSILVPIFGYAALIVFWQLASDFISKHPYKRKEFN